MKILILGGTGAMGRHVVELLNRCGNEVIVTSRTDHSDANGIKYVKGNAKDLSFITAICKEHYNVIIDFMVYNIEEFQNRIDIILPSTNQYVFMSSARVYADSPIIKEDSPRLLDVCPDQEYVLSNEYAIAKAKEEDLLINSKYKNWTIVRPSLTYAENRLQLGVYEKENWLYRAIQGRSIVFSQDLINNYYTLTYGKDVAAGIAGLVGKSESLGQAYHIVISEAIKWEDVLTIYLDVLEKRLGKRPKVVITCESTNMKIQNAKYQLVYGRYFNRRFDNSKINNLVETASWLKPKEGLSKCLDVFLDNPIFLSIDWHKEALIDKAAKEWTPLREIPGKRNKLRYLRWRI